VGRDRIDEMQLRHFRLALQCSNRVASCSAKKLFASRYLQIVGDLRSSVPLPLEEFLCFESRHASCARGCYRLSVAAVLHIAACVDPRHASEHVIGCPEIAVLIGVKLALKDFGVGNMTDAEEHRAGRKIPLFPADYVPQT